MTFNRILLISLVVCLIINTFVHFQSPAYRYYKEQFTLVQKTNEQWHKKFLDRVLPIVSVFTNSINTCSAGSPVSSNRVEGVSLSSQIKDKESFINISFFSCSGKDYFQFEGHIYSVGDMFFGSPIVYLSPTYVVTGKGSFLARNVINTNGEVKQ